MPKVQEIAENLYRFMCPGCQEFHTFPCNGRVHPANGATWTFDGNLDSPMVTPSLNIAWGKEADPNWEEPVGEDAGPNWSGRCHSVITVGKISFASDSTHALSGKEDIDLPNID